MWIGGQLIPFIAIIILSTVFGMGNVVRNEPCGVTLRMNYVTSFVVLETEVVTQHVL